jgi:hypothetical protein
MEKFYNLKLGKLLSFCLALILTQNVLAQAPGNALNFNGVNNYVSIPNSPSLQPATVTVEAWVNPAATTNATTVVLGKNNSQGPSGGANFEDYFILLQNNKFVAVMSNGLQKTAQSNTNYVAGKYYYVAAVYSSTSVSLYVNGVLQQSTPTGFPLDHANYPVVLGAQTNYASSYASMTLDEVRIFGTDRSSQIVSDGLAPINPSTAGLVAYYNFDEGTAGGNNAGITSLTDNSTNSNFGTLNNFTLNGPTSNWVESYAMVVPVATSASSVSTTAFTANWTAPAVGTVDNYILDVATDNAFTNFVPGFNGYNAGTALSVSVTGLTANSVYYYRVRAEKASVSGQGGYSGTSSVRTSASGTFVPPGNALDFNGVNTYVTIPDAPSLDPSVVTVEAWVKPATNTGVEVILGKNNSHGPNGAYFEDYFLEMQNGKFAAVMSSSNNAQKIAFENQSFVVGKWYHVSAVYSSTSLKLFVNGVLQQSIPTNFNLDHANYPLVIGAQTNFSTSYANATLDEVRVFSTDRSSLIASDMKAPINPSTAGLSAYYNFDQGNAGGTNTDITTLVDQTSNSNNGTLSNFALTGSSSNFLESYAMVVPTATAAGILTATSFTANWTAPSVGTVDKYLLDIATDSLYTSFVPGYNSYNAGTSLSTTVTGLAPNKRYYYRVRADKASVTGQGAFSNTIIANLIELTYYSKASGDLSNPSTYGTLADGTGTTPTDFITSRKNTFQLANRSSYTLTADLNIKGKLNIPSGSALDLASYTLSVDSLSGTGTLSGSSTASLTLDTLAGNVAFTTGSQILKTLTLTSGATATVTTPLAIADIGNVSVGANAALTLNGILTLKSSATSTARISTVGVGGSITGTATVERYMSDRRAWRLITSSVTGTQTINAAWQEGAAPNTNPNPGYGTFVTGGSVANGFDQNYANNTSLETYNSTGNSLIPVANTTTTTINDNNGYFIFVRGNRGLNINDNTAHGSTILRETGGLRVGVQPDVAIGTSGYTVVGNPYAAPVDFNKVNRTNVPNKFYAYDYQLNSVGGYVLVDGTSGGAYTVTPASPSGISNLLQSGEAILVPSSGSAGTLTFDETSKVETTLASLTSTRDAIAMAKGVGSSSDIAINLQSKADQTVSTIDGALARYALDFSNKVDQADAVKLPNFNENIALVRGGQNLMLERRTSFKGNDTLFVQLSNMQAKGYNLQIDPTKFGIQGTTAYLVDAYQKTSTVLDLTAVNNVAFNVTNDAASYQNRFMITFTAPVTTASNFADVLNKHVGITTKGISVYPNPAINKQINLNFNSMPQGKYTITLISPYGDQLKKLDFNYDGYAASTTIDAAQAHGVYLVIINANGYSHTEKVIVN